MAYFIIVKHGDLLNEDADFIVNASNTRLILGSGVSMAFKRHCGIELQHEMNTVLNSIDNNLIQGDVVATSSGRANNFTYSLHVAIMDYAKGIKQNEKENHKIGVINLNIQQFNEQEDNQFLLELINQEERNFISKIKKEL